MQPASRSDDGTGPGAPGPAAAIGDELDEDAVGSLHRRRAVIRLLVILVLLIPAVGVAADQGFTGKAVFLIPATGVLILATDQLTGARLPLSGWRQRSFPYLLAAIVLLGAALFAVGGMSWLTALAVAAGALGRFAPTTRLASAGIAACAAVGFGVSAWLSASYGNVVSATIVPALAGFLAHSAARRNELIDRLRETRAELARTAVAEERLRIARDLHDLLGHSLSLIALKAELAGRLLEADPARAAGEIADLETVARRSLTEVRQAVTSYRQPSLAAELAAARRMLTSAGVDVQLEVPTAYSLPAAVGALLAWTVREGATNIVRHAAASRADIRIQLAGSLVCAELADDGAGLAAGRSAGPPHGASPDGASPHRASPHRASPHRASPHRASPHRASPDGASPDGSAPGAIPDAAGQAGERPAVTRPAGPDTGGPDTGGGSGLAGLAERAARLGGAMVAGPGREGGFRLRVEVPLTGHGSARPADMASTC